MSRLTHRDASGHAVLEASAEEAAERLALFEDVCDAVTAEYDALGTELDRLRAAGKLVDAQVLSLLRVRGLLP